MDVAYSYMRFSTTEQRKGDIIRRQSALRDAFVERQKLRLDTTLTFVDAGVSGHKGRHRSSDKYALGYFLSLVKTGRIAAGSYLIVESLDRLSREDVDEALELLLSLTRSGIKVVQLLPAEVVFQKPVEPMKLMMGIMELSRGNSESKMKSERIGAAWEGKRQKAREGKAISASCPRWLKRKGDKYEIIPERAAAVRLMFELAADGFGINGVIKRLIAGGHKPFGRASRWSNSYIGKIFAGRTVLGEYQPMKDRLPCGEPIKNFYPALVDETLYYRVQAGLKQRTLYAGGRSVNDVNIFQGILYHALDGDKFEYRGVTDHQGEKVFKYSRYVNSLALVSQAKLTSFPVYPFETGVLSCLAEIDPMDVLPGHDSTGDEVMSLSHRYEEAAQRLREIEAQLADPANGESIGVLVAAANRVGATVKEIGTKLAEARTKAVNPQSEAWGACQTLIEAMNTAEDREASRLRLQSAVRRVVTKAVCLFARSGLRQIACVQLHLAGTDAIRTVFVRHRRELVNVKGRTPAYTSWSTLKDELPGKIDIAERHAEVLPVLRKMCEEEYWHRAFEPDRLSSREVIRRRKAAYMKTYRKK